MKKKLPKILSIVTVVALLAAIPASTQILSDSETSKIREVDLGLLTMVNRLELSEEQMNALHEILSGMLDERAALEDHRAAFEDAMIAFNGSNDELDAALTAFREEQMALMDAMRDTMASAMESVGDLLSLNQGLQLKGLLPQLQGARGASAIEESSGYFRILGRQPSLDADTQEEVRSLRQMPMDMQTNRSRGFRPGRLTEMMSEHHGRGNIADLRGQMAQRFKSVEGEIPESLREQMSGRFGIGGNEDSACPRPEGINDSGASAWRGLADGKRSSGLASAQGGRVMSLRRGQDMRKAHDPFGRIEQLAEILELKLEVLNEGL